MKIILSYFIVDSKVDGIAQYHSIYNSKIDQTIIGKDLVSLEVNWEIPNKSSGEYITACGRGKKIFYL